MLAGADLSFMDEIALLAGVRREWWWGEGACRAADVDPAWFFPARGEPPTWAREVCASCPVVVECAEWAIVNVEKHGIWGGLSERERRRIRRQRNLAEAS